MIEKDRVLEELALSLEWSSEDDNPRESVAVKIFAVRKALELLKKWPEWISVDDQLPDHNQIVVVSDGIHTWDVGQFHGLSHSQRRDLWWWKKTTIKKVKWWMPKKTALPCPPKEVKQDG